MDKIVEYERLIRHYLRLTATIFIYSTPNFVLEAVLALIIVLIYGYLHFEVTDINRKTLRLRPNVVLCEKGSFSKGSGSRIRHYHGVFAVSGNSSATIEYKRVGKDFGYNSNSQIKWGVPSSQFDNCLANRQLEKKRYSEHLANLTPEQFVKIDKERKLREKELDSYMMSLSTLCKNVLKRKYSSKTLSRQVEMARESLQCNKMSLEGKYLGFKTDAMTSSLFNMLEQMITNSSLQNPLPFKGDITTLALDVAELSTDTHYISKNLGKWDANNSSSCISEFTDETESTTGKVIKAGPWINNKEESSKVYWQLP